MRRTVLLPWLAAAAVGLSACSDPVAPPPPASPSEAAEGAADSAAGAARKVLKALLSPSGIGMNLPYVEQQAGPAMRTDGHTHTFQIEQCTLELTTDEENRSVKHIRLALTPQCQATSEGLLGAEKPVLLNSLTFQGLSDAYAPGVVMADCLHLCGNADDPSVYFMAEGSRAQGFLTLVLEQPLVSDAVIEAANRWEAAMVKREGKDWVIDTGFNCEPNKYRDVAMQAMGHLKVAYLSFGDSLITYPSCQKTEGGGADSPAAEAPAEAAPAAPVAAASGGSTVVVPKPRDDCDMEYDQLLLAAGLKEKSVAVHGPDEPDFNGWGCPYRIQPAPGTAVPKGSTVTYRYGWEAG